MKLFKNVEQDIINSNKFEKIVFKRKEILFHEKQVCDDFFYLLEGKVTLQSNTSQGKKKIFFTIDANDIINDFDVTFHRFPYEAVAFENCTVLKIKQDDLRELFKESYQLMVNCLDLQSHRSRRLYRQLKNTSSINIEKKLAAKLWKFAKDYGKHYDDTYTLIDFKVNNTYLADVIGCSRETVSRAIQALVKLELVQIIEHKYYVKQKELLEYYRS